MKTTLMLTVVPLAAAMTLIPTAAFAAPATLPTGDTLYAIECDSGPDSSVPSRQLFTVDPATAALTAVGTGTAYGSYCAGPAAVDATTGTVYFVDWAVGRTLSIMDPATGLTTEVGVFNDGEGTYDVDAIAIQPDGDAFALYNGTLFSLDLATAEMTLIGDGASGAPTEMWALTAHPQTGAIYGVSSYDGSALYTFDEATGDATLVQEVAQQNVWALAFDSAGTLWVENNYELATVDVADWTATYAPVGTFSLASAPEYGDYFTESLFILPAQDQEEQPEEEQPEEEQQTDGETAQPELAETGADPALVGMLGSIGLLALLGGGIALTMQRRARSTR